MAKLARDCGLSKRGTQKVIRWLTEHGFLVVALKAGPNQASLYSILIPEMTNSSVHDELQSSSRTEVHEVANSGVREVTNGATR